MPRTKKRPRAFFGTRRQDLPRPPPLSPEDEAQADSEDGERPIPVETASSKKLALSPSFSSTGEPSSRDLHSSQPRTSSAGESFDYVGKMEGHRLVSCEELSKAVGEIGVCSECGSPLKVKEDLVTRRGLVSKLMICCTNTACSKEVTISDPYSSTAKSLNTRSVFAMREIGKGQAGLESLCGWMNMLPPLCASTYSERNHDLAKVAMECAVKNMRAASDHLHDLRGVPRDEVIDVCVTCDGTWSKRGFTATYGIVAVIVWETGQVLDFQIKSKRCIVCAKKLSTMKRESEEFKTWYESHKGSCELTHHGSSPSMEAAAALDLWKRSEECLHLRYTEIISDGDSKTIPNLQSGKPYGANVLIIKHECVGHIQKRVGKLLREMKRQLNVLNREIRKELAKLKAELKEAEKLLREVVKKQKESEKPVRGKGRSRGGGKGKGKAVEEGGSKRGGGFEEEVERSKEEVERLKEAVKVQKAKVITGLADSDIDLLQTYYGNAIRSHVDELEGMVRACWAVFYHSVSTDENPQHQYCPVGAESWCKYRRALANHQDVLPHTPRIPANYEPFVKPVFDKLCDEELLAKCVKGATQNRNESYNNLIWARSPKTEFSSLPTTQIAVSNATIMYNSGAAALAAVIENMEVEAGSLCSAFLAARDECRVKRAALREGEVAKKRRKVQRVAAKQVEEARIEEEGVSYEAGGF